MQPIQPMDLPLLQPEKKPAPVDQAGQSFSTMITDMVANVEQQQEKADMAVQQLHAGNAKNLHETMIAMEEADISIRFMVQVRNKALEAYQEIMRMQV